MRPMYLFSLAHQKKGLAYTLHRDSTQGFDPQQLRKSTSMTTLKLVKTTVTLCNSQKPLSLVLLLSK